MKRVLIDCWTRLSQDTLNRAIEQLPKRLAMQGRSQRRGGWSGSSPLPTKDCGPCDFYRFRHSALMALFNVVTCCILWIITVWGEPPHPSDIFLATGL